jgi:hypothetical protein
MAKLPGILQGGLRAHQHHEGFRRLTRGLGFAADSSGSGAVILKFMYSLLSKCEIPISIALAVY